MVEITMGQLRKRIAEYIRQKYNTQAEFAKAVGMSASHVSGVLSGRKAVPLAWAELVGCKIEVRVTFQEWAKFGGKSPTPDASKKCLACGEYHYGISGLPCPKMTPVARGGEHG